MPIALASHMTHHTTLDAQAQAIFTLVLVTFRTTSRGYHLCTLKKHRLFDLVVFPLDSRLIHDKVVLNQPAEEDFFVYGCVQSSLEHLVQEFVHLLLIFLELVALFHQKVLNSLAINRPVN